MPLKLAIEQQGKTLLTEDSTNDYKLVCNTNIMKTIAHQITWLKDGREILTDDRMSLFSSLILTNTTYANSVLVFKSINNRSLISTYKGVYQCKLNIRYPDVGEGDFYSSEAKKVVFNGITNHTNLCNQVIF